MMDTLLDHLVGEEELASGQELGMAIQNIAIVNAFSLLFSNIALLNFLF